MTNVSRYFVCGILINFLHMIGLADAHAQVYGTCPSNGLTSSTNTINLQGNCEIDGNVNLSGSAALTMTNGILTIKGNLILNDSSALAVINGGLTFPQTNYSQYSITLNDKAQLVIKNSTLVTNGTQQDNFSMGLQSNGTSMVYVDSSTLNTNAGSWLLGSFNNNSKLIMINTQNLPTEIYPADASRISISGSSLAGLWLDFPTGSSGTVNIPKKSPQGAYNFSFGPTTGIAYSVNILESQGRIGLNSHPNSTMIVNGDGTSGANDADIVFGYYIENNTGPVSISGLFVGTDVSRQFTDQGRDLQLNHVNLNPFSWQVYVNQSNGYPVFVTNSIINEIAAMTDGYVNISNSVLQLAVTGAVGPGSIMNIVDSLIWSQAIQAQNGGQMTIADSQIYGNFITATGTGSKITMINVGDNTNGTPPQSCVPVNGFPPNDNGVPLCNPFNPLYQCAQIVPSSAGATITAEPSLACSPM